MKINNSQLNIIKRK